MTLSKFLSQFPDDATSWSQATDEIRDIARNARMYLEEMDRILIAPLNFRAIKTPGEWNTLGKLYISRVIAKMSVGCKADMENYLKESFNITSLK